MVLENLHFNKFPGDAAAAGPGTILQEPQVGSNSLIELTAIGNFFLKRGLF